VWLYLSNKIELLQTVQSIYKMECPVCFEINPLQSLKGCTHSICTDCASVMGQQSKHQIQPFGEFVILPETFVSLECPLCRAKEPNPITPRVTQELMWKYPTGYRIWFETALFAGEDGTWFYSSRRKNNVVIYPNYDDDVYDLLDRIEFGSRTTACWLDDTNMYNDSSIFIQWIPVRYTYPYANPYKTILT